MKKRTLLALALIVCATAFSQPQERIGEILGNRISERNFFERGSLEKPTWQSPTAISAAKRAAPANISAFGTTKWKLDSIVCCCHGKQTFIYDNYGRLSRAYSYHGSGNSKNRIEITLDSNGNIIAEISSKWFRSNNAWEYLWKIERTFDNNGNQTASTSSRWINSAWENEGKSESTFDSNGNEIRISSRWNNNAWENSAKVERTFDSNGNLITEIWSEWINNAWEYRSKRERTFDSIGNEITTIYWFEWINDGWKVERTFDSNGNLITEIWSGWINNAWEYDWKVESTFDSSGNEITQISSRWNNNAWENGGKLERTFDSNGNEITAIVSDWINDAWEYVLRVEGTFDLSYSRSDLIFPDLGLFCFVGWYWLDNVNNKIVKENHYSWCHNTNEWRLFITLTFYYSEVELSNSVITPEINIDRNPVAFYNIMGVRLRTAPERGIYIVVFCDGSTEKRAR